MTCLATSQQLIRFSFYHNCDGTQQNQLKDRLGVERPRHQSAYEYRACRPFDANAMSLRLAALAVSMAIEVGADGYGEDAVEAVEVAKRLMQKKREG